MVVISSEAILAQNCIPNEGRAIDIHHYRAGPDQQQIEPNRSLRNQSFPQRLRFGAWRIQDGSPRCVSQNAILLDFANTNVFELGPHRISSVQLQGQNTFGEHVIRMIGEVQNQLAIQVVLNVIPFRNDHNIIPIVNFH